MRARNGVFGTIITISSSMDIQSFECGGEHAAILTTSGRLYTWGKVSFGRLGHGVLTPNDHISRVLTVAAPKIVQHFVDQNIIVRQVACGFAYTTCVDIHDRMYTWGAGDNGRLGTGDEEDRSLPTLVSLCATNAPRMQLPVHLVVAGSVHTLALMSSGMVYSFGKKEYTGHNATKDVLVPRLLDAFHGRPIEQISVGPGGYHTIALTCPCSGSESKRRRTYEEGKTMTGRDETERFEEEEEEWEENKYNDDEQEETRHVYTWGHNRVGQLGVGNEQLFPLNYEGFMQSTPFHVSYLTSKNDDLCRTRDSDPDQANDREKSNKRQSEAQSHPLLEKEATYEPIIKVVAGWGHSAMLSCHGSVYVCGRNCKGQLGLGDIKRFPKNERGHQYSSTFRRVHVPGAGALDTGEKMMRPSWFDAVDGMKECAVVDVACGGEHTCLLSESGGMHTFGQGSSGQLGHYEWDQSGMMIPMTVPKRVERVGKAKGLSVKCGNACTIVMMLRPGPPTLVDICRRVLTSVRWKEEEEEQDKEKDKQMRARSNKK